MGAWGSAPQENDDFADAWSEVITAVNQIAKKCFPKAARDVDGGDLYAAVGVVLAMGDAGIPVDGDTYDDACGSLDNLFDQEFWKTFRNPAKAKESMQAARKKLRAMEKKSGPAVGLAGGHLPLVIR